MSEAKKQLKKIKDFISLNQVQSEENIILKQIEFHYKILDGINRSMHSVGDAFVFIYDER